MSTVMNREKSSAMLLLADENAADAESVALVAIGFALLEIADAIRDRTADIVASLKGI